MKKRRDFEFLEILFINSVGAGIRWIIDKIIPEF